MWSALHILHAVFFKRAFGSWEHPLACNHQESRDLSPTATSSWTPPTAGRGPCLQMWTLLHRHSGFRLGWDHEQRSALRLLSPNSDPHQLWDCKWLLSQEMCSTLLCSKWKLIQASDIGKADPPHQEKALWLCPPTLEVSPLHFSASCFEFLAKGFLHSLEYRALGGATQWHGFIHFSGSPKARCRGYWEEQVRAPAHTGLLAWAHNNTFSVPQVQLWDRTVGLAVFSETSVCLSSAQPDDAEVYSACKKLTQPCDSGPASEHLRLLQSHLPPTLNASSLRSCQAFRAGTESCPHLHSIPWLKESR